MLSNDLVTLTVKCLTLPVAIVSSIQAAACLGLSIVTIFYYHNIIDPSDSSSSNDYGYVIYLLYLRHKTHYAGFIVDPVAFNIIMYFYMTFSFLWMTVSLTLVWATINKKWSLTSKLGMMWSVATIAISILDVCTMSLIAADLQKAHSTGPPEIFESAVPSLPDTNLVNNEMIYTAMGIVMSAAAKGYILLILNVIFAIVLVVAGRKAEKLVTPSMPSGRTFIHAYDNSTRPVSLYDQIEIDKSFQNEGFQLDEAIISSRQNDLYNNSNGRNPLSHSNRSSIVYSQTSSYPFDAAKSTENSKLAKIGKVGGTRSSPRRVPSPTIPDKHNNEGYGMPHIPEPDYSPSSSPKMLPKSALRTGNNCRF